MEDENQDAKLARIDERTKNMDAKLDKFIEAHRVDKQRQDDKIDDLEKHRNWIAGIGTALTAIFGIHIGRH